MNARFLFQGAYRNDEGKPVVLSSVREAEKRILGNFNMEYLPISGLKAFNQESVKLAFGDNSPVVRSRDMKLGACGVAVISCSRLP